MLDPKVILGLSAKVTEAPKAPLTKDARDPRMTSLKGLKDFKVWAENFIIELKSWQLSSMTTYEGRE